MMRKEVLAPIFGALLVGVLLGYFVGSGLQSSWLQSELSAITAERDSLQSQVNSDLSEITYLTTDRQALQHQVSQLAASVAEMNVTIATLESLQGNASSAQLQAKIAQLNATIATLQSQLTSAQFQITALTSDKQALLSQVSALTTLVAQLNATIISLSKGEASISDVNFSPKGGCADQVIYWLGRASSSVHILIYSFTLDSIGDAVLDTYHKGVDVKIVFEKSQVSQYSEFFRLAAAGVSVRNDTNPGDMHMKVAIIDGYIVLVGSFNWSAAAENQNNEVLLVIKSASLATAIEAQFQRIWTTGR